LFIGYLKTTAATLMCKVINSTIKFTSLLIYVEIEETAVLSKIEQLN